MLAREKNQEENRRPLRSVLYMFFLSVTVTSDHSCTRKDKRDEALTLQLDGLYVIIFPL